MPKNNALAQPPIPLLTPLPSLAPLPSLTPHLTPAGHLIPVQELDAPSLTTELNERLAQAFAQGVGNGLLHLGAVEITTALPATWAWWRDFAALYVTGLTALAEEDEIHVALPDALTLELRIADAPPMTGVEYLNADVLASLWQQIETTVKKRLTDNKINLHAFLKSQNPAWNLVGRVHFNLAENRRDPEAPFAFLATYTSRLSTHGKAQHLPLSQALAEFSGGKKKAQLLSLLLPVQQAARACDWLADMVESGEIYHPLRWQVNDACRFLNDLPKCEAAGIVVRMPATWRMGRPTRPSIKATLGSQPPSVLGMDALLDFNLDINLDGESLSHEEINALLKSSEGLQWIRGKWVQVDHKQINILIQRFRDIEQATRAGMDFKRAMRLLAGATLDEEGIAANDWSEVVAGPWLAEMLQGMRSPEGLAALDPGPDLTAELRPYQAAGVRWLYLLTRLGLGACLADDMGLGKTIQILALLLLLKRESKIENAAPSLLVAPASLLANWAQEAERFTPTLRCLIAHPSAMPQAQLRELNAAQMTGFDLIITSYATLLRLPQLTEMHWRLVVADEAQAIKNPSAKQTRQVKKLHAASHIALTGTPVENRLSDLWSIFDFTHPGLLGTEKKFAQFSKGLTHFGPLRTLVKPYILRRLKSDKRVINDLPDKTELTAWCQLNKTQAVHYQRAVKELALALDNKDGIERKGLVLAFLMRFKQICNHPSQWLGDGSWQPEDSGKFARLRELAEVIAAKQEKLLVFTQFQETTAPLAAFLGSIFGREGLVLTGATPVAKRRDLVKRFQEDELTPFFILSIKAGGSGLNLTAASHVIHFDRWWNPAVENQATDRAYRIGQRRNVLVHKFVCRGTIEERIDALISAKQQLVKDVLEGGAEINLTEMSNEALLNLVKLDINTLQD